MFQDASGNYFAAGSSVNRSTNKDFLLVKFSSIGDTVWTLALDGGFGGPDEVTAITSDNSGNIFLTGFAKGYYTGYDILTVKVNPIGDTLWTKKYNYQTANEDDIPTSISLDNSGNIIIGGYSDSDPSSLISNDDCLLLKYSSTGSLLWFQRYNGINNGVDRIAKVLINSAGEIYAGGRADNGDDDYILLKYSSAGAQIWLRTIDNGSNDRITTMAMDAAGACYVSGRSSNGTDHDIVTVKYNAAGVVVFNSTYDYIGDDRATAITLDASGNVYVCGQSDGDLTANKIFDYVTVKYNSAGVQQWASRYAGAGNGDDIPVSISVNSTGDVWVTGYSDADASATVSNDWATLKYNSTGAQQFVKSEGLAAISDESSACLIDNAGKTVVAGFISSTAANSKATIIRYTSTGTKEIEKFYEGKGDNQDEVNALILSSDGSLITAGFSVEKDQDPNMCVTKISTAGATVWKKTLSGNSSTGSTDNALALVCDASGNIYVTGYTKNSNAGSDFTTIKFNQLGDTIWTRKYSFQTGASDRAVAIALDAQNNIIVTGYSDSDPSASTNYDFATIKYNPAGTQLWAVRYNSAFNADDRPVAMRIANSGNIYIAGRSFNGSDDDMVLVKYNSNGIQQWVHNWSGGSGDDRNTALLVDANENCYVSGRTFNGSDLDGVLLKVGSTGQTSWVKLVNGTGISDDRLNDAAFLSDGSIVCAGQTDSDASIGINLDGLAAAWTSDGNVLWNQIITAPGAIDEYFNCIAIDANNTIIVGGAATNLQANSAPLTARLTSNGTLSWYGLPNATSSLGGEIKDVLINATSVYSAGYLENNPGMSNALTLKYNDSTTGIGNLNSVSIHITPNPSSESISIKRDQREASSLIIQDINGRVVYTSAFNENEMKLNVSDWRSGVYHIIVSGKDRVESFPIVVE